MQPANNQEVMTIVVPVYNRAHLIERCLDSFKSQTYRPLHVIVVDNASTDNTVEKIEDWIKMNERGDFSIELLHESRPGAAYARQKGLLHVVTEKVMFFDSDDILRPECVSAVMTAWEKNPSDDIIAWPVKILYENKVQITHTISGNLLERHLVHAILRTQGYAVKADCIKKAGGWKGEFPVWNDLETGTRILLKDPKVTGLSDLLADVYHQSESITGESFSSKAGNWEKSLDGIDKSIDESGRKDAGRLHNIVTYRRAILAADYAKEGHMELAVPLYEKAMSEIENKKRPLIRFAYHWTKLGMRGAFSIVGPLL